MTSLPVPDSPRSSTVVSVDATCVASRRTCRHTGDSPTTRGPLRPSANWVRARTRVSIRDARETGSGVQWGAAGWILRSLVSMVRLLSGCRTMRRFAEKRLRGADLCQNRPTEEPMRDTPQPGGPPDPATESGSSAELLPHVYDE